MTLREEILKESKFDKTFVLYLRKKDGSLIGKDFSNNLKGIEMIIEKWFDELNNGCNITIG